MFHDFKRMDNRPVAIQLKEYIKQMITRGILQKDQKLPSTRELSSLLNLSRNTVINAYAELEAEEFLNVVKGKGSFVSHVGSSSHTPWQLDWRENISNQALLAEEMDLMKHSIRWHRGMISFTSIAPDEKLFDLHNFKRAFLDRISLEGEILLNYGYAKGYKPLMEYLLRYMESKGVDLTHKDILITNGFTEGFDLVLSALNKKSGRVLCENPTHHTAMKTFTLHGFEITGIEMEPDGIHLQQLEQELSKKIFDCAYLIPSYHNPTGIVMSSRKRVEILNLFAKHQVPIIEDGFNEELRYSGSHVAPLITCSGKGNSIIYLGSFSKILFPGMRIGWILADQELIGYLESLKRARTIHTSTIDQAILYQYLHDGYFRKYLKKAKSIYKHKYELAVQSCKQFIPYKKMTGDGGLHLFLELDDHINTRDLLHACHSKGVVFTPGDVFFTNQKGHHTLRLGFSRVSDEQIREGIHIIGEIVKTQKWGG